MPFSASPSRPKTPLSRPGTSASKSVSGETSSGAASDGHVVALIEGNAIGREVGIATYSPTTGRVTLSQLADSLSFARSLHHVGCHPPDWLLVTDSAFPSAVEGGASVPRSRSWPGARAKASKREPTMLVRAVMDAWQGAEVVPVARKYWTDEAGKSFLAQLAVDDEDRPALLVATEQKYLALCAVAALFKYLAASHSLVFAPASLKIHWDPLEGTMFIDADTAKNLEIVHNRVNIKSNQSLFGVLNRTHTPMATRLLWSNLLQPTRVQSTLEGRLDAVDELIANEDRFERIRNALRPLSKIDIDKLIAHLTQQDAETDVSRAERRVTQMLSMRQVVRSLIAVCSAVDGVQSELLSKIHVILTDERLEIIDELIADRLEEDTGQPDRKKTGLAQRNAKIWAVKASHSRLLDVARETYKENIQDIIELVQGYQTVHHLPSLSVTFGQNLTMIVNEDDIDEDGLPDVFKNVSKKGPKKFSCTTLELKKRQQRYNDSLAEIFLLSDQIIQQLVADVLQGVSALYKASEAIAMLDLLWSHAHTASLMNYTRPEFTKTLAIKGGKHPILDKFNDGKPVVANDVYASHDTSSFQIVQGPNMSGKTTYLTTIALISVQAMIGSFVPAEYASVPLHDALLTRLSNDDNLTGSLSTFAAEMRATAGILSLATADSLVVIDELGRGTSPLEGTAIAHAIAEELIRSKAACFFATHFFELATTLSGYESVVNLHLQVEASRKGAVRYNYHIVDGVPEESHYGLQLAEVAGLPADVLAVAQDVSGTLTRLEREGKRASKSNKATQRRKVLLSVREKLQHALHSDLEEEPLREYLAAIQADAVRDLSVAGL